MAVGVVASGRRTNRAVRTRARVPAGRHCVILDDLVQTGGTLIECAKALKVRHAALPLTPMAPRMAARRLRAPWGRTGV